MTNAIAAIYPYYKGGMWMFDDPAVGLREELFVAGIDKIMDVMTASIPNAKEGFRLVFSDNPFPGHNTVLEHIEQDQLAFHPATKTRAKEWIPFASRGDWYLHPETGMEGWLCPALLKYFAKAPARIYVQLEADPDVQAKIDERAAARKLLPKLKSFVGYEPGGAGGYEEDIGWWERTRGMMS